jgi:DNA-binding response OmpR family regulator
MDDFGMLHAESSGEDLMRVLFLGTNLRTIRVLRKAAQNIGFTLAVESDPEPVWEELSWGQYAIVVLDLGLEGVDAVAIRKRLHEENPTLAALIIVQPRTIRGCIADLEFGITDYILAPFSAYDMTVRLDVLARRIAVRSDPLLKIGSLTLDRSEQRAQRGHRNVALTKREYSVLEYLMRNAGHKLTRSMINEKVWGTAMQQKTNRVEVYINYLRRKIDDGFAHKLIRTTWGRGYEFISEPSAQLDFDRTGVHSEPDLGKR